MPRPVRVGLVLTLVAVVVLVALWSLQRRLLYFPAGPPPPVDQALPDGQAVTLPTEDGLDLGAWWIPGGPTAVVVFPGNAGNRAARVPLARVLHELGVSVLLVDYRGYGGNPGRPSETGLAADARAAVAWIRARDEVSDIVYFGESLGAAVAVSLATEHPPSALVLRSPFTSLAAMARLHYGPVPGFLLRDRYPSDERVADVTSPVLVLVAADDRIVPAEHSRRLYDLVTGPKQLASVPGAGHNDQAALDGPVLVEAVRSFLAEQDLLP